jgi:hypothetical protein
MRNGMPLTMVPKPWPAARGTWDADTPMTSIVRGLPPNLSVEIAEMDGRWQVLVCQDGLAGDCRGSFASADAVLAAIAAELGRLGA